MLLCCTYDTTVYVEIESVQCVVMKVLVMMLFSVNSVLLQQECSFLKIFV